MTTITKKRSPYHSPLNFEKGVVEMIHGAGGKASSQLIDELFMAKFDNALLNAQSDQATFSVEAGRMVMATDSHVITPLFFPGGNIGSLAVHGTVNDVAMSGATPLYLSAGFILEEGFPLRDLKAIVESMAMAAKEAGVSIITGDTKVVEKGSADGVFINTTGVGVLANGINLNADNIQPGDKILLSGTMGDHGISILSNRENLTFETDILSDSQSLHGLVKTMIDAVPSIHYMRDPTRGGVAAVINELCHQRGVGALLQEAAIKVKPAVASACELLGIDPLYVANEGKLIAFCPPDQADALLRVMQSHPKGLDAAIIGEVLVDDQGFVQLQTRFGGRRVVDWINGEQLPRIC